MTRILRTLNCYALASMAMFAIFACTHQRQTSTSAPRTVVFICEHGAARSVIAAAYFNKLAAERHLNFHAIARGLTPQPDLSTASAIGLEQDGVPFPETKPQPLRPEEMQTAARVVAFCPLPKSLTQERVESFDVPAPNEGYGVARDAILVHVKALVDQLASQVEAR
jgi:arsenate reductase (thioredoxin)